MEGEDHLHIHIKDTSNGRKQLSARWSRPRLSFRPPTHHFQLQLLVQGGVELLLLPAVHLHDLHNNPVLVVLQPPHRRHNAARGRAHVLSCYIRYRWQQRRRRRTGKRGVGGDVGGFLVAWAACLHGNCLGLAFPLSGRVSSSTLGFGLPGASSDSRRRMKIWGRREMKKMKKEVKKKKKIKNGGWKTGSASRANAHCHPRLVTPSHNLKRLQFFLSTSALTQRTSMARQQLMNQTLAHKFSVCLPSDARRIERNKGPCVGAALLCVGSSTVQTLACSLAAACEEEHHGKQWVGW